MVADGFPSSGPGWAWFVVNLGAFLCVLVVAYRHNRVDYRDSFRKALLWALALASVWPITVAAWFFWRRRYSTPLSTGRGGARGSVFRTSGSRTARR